MAVGGGGRGAERRRGRKRLPRDKIIAERFLCALCVCGGGVWSDCCGSQQTVMMVSNPGGVRVCAVSYGAFCYSSKPIATASFHQSHSSSNSNLLTVSWRDLIANHYRTHPWNATNTHTTLHPARFATPIIGGSFVNSAESTQHRDLCAWRQLYPE